MLAGMLAASSVTGCAAVNSAVGLAESIIGTETEETSEENLEWTAEEMSEGTADCSYGETDSPEILELYLDDSSSEAIPSSYVIEDFPEIFQNPELPTGCEITALTMALNYYGYDVDKTTMAAVYLPTEDYEVYESVSGVKYGNDLNEYFLGDPFTEEGYVCGTEAIITAADAYLADAGSSLAAVDLTGEDPETLYSLVSMDIPVVVWVTINMEDRYETEGWYTSDGEYVEWSNNDHGAVLIGYDEDFVVIADPIAGIVGYDREQFESVYEQRGEKSVILV